MRSVSSEVLHGRINEKDTYASSFPTFVFSEEKVSTWE